MTIMEHVPGATVERDGSEHADVDATATTTAPAPSPAPAGGRPGISTATLALGAIFIAAFAFLASIFAVALAARSVDEHRAAVRAIEAAGSGVAAPTVTLTEFSISPDPLTVPAGATALVVRNEGTVEHNLSIDGVASPMLAPGESGELDLTGLAPGTYTMVCDVAGHAGAGMTGTVTIQ